MRNNPRWFIFVYLHYISANINALRLSFQLFLKVTHCISEAKAVFCKMFYLAHYTSLSSLLIFNASWCILDLYKDFESYIAIVVLMAESVAFILFSFPKHYSLPGVPWQQTHYAFADVKWKPGAVLGAEMSQCHSARAAATELSVVLKGDMEDFVCPLGPASVRAVFA